MQVISYQVVNHSSHFSIKTPLIWQCYGEDDCCYVTSNAHFFQVTVKHFCSFLQTNLKTSSFPIIYALYTMLHKNVPYPAFRMISYSLQNLIWNSCSTSWLRFFSSIFLLVFPRQCSKPISVRAFVQQKDNFGCLGGIC